MVEVINKITGETLRNFSIKRRTNQEKRKEFRESLREIDIKNILGVTSCEVYKSHQSPHKKFKGDRFSVEFKNEWYLDIEEIFIKGKDAPSYRLYIDSPHDERYDWANQFEKNESVEDDYDREDYDFNVTSWLLKTDNEILACSSATVMTPKMVLTCIRDISSSSLVHPCKLTDKDRTALFELKFSWNADEDSRNAMEKQLFIPEAVDDYDKFVLKYIGPKGRIDIQQKYAQYFRDSKKSREKKIEEDEKRRLENQVYVQNQKLLADMLGWESQKVLYRGYKTTQEKLDNFYWGGQELSKQRKLLIKINAQMVNEDRISYREWMGKIDKRIGTRRILTGISNVDVKYPSGQMHPARMRVTTDNLVVIEPVTRDTAYWVINVIELREMIQKNFIIDLGKMNHLRRTHAGEGKIWLQEQKFK